MLKIDIKEISSVQAADLRALEQVWDLAFAGQQVEDLGWCAAQWVIFGRLEDQVVSLLGLLRREIRVGEQTIVVGGVGGVATHPGYQRRGYAGLVLERAARYLRETMRVPFGLLVCSNERVPYYAKFGWHVAPGPMYFDFRGTKRLFHEPVMVLPVLDQPWPQGSIDLQGGPW